VRAGPHEERIPVSRIDDLLIAALRALPPKPPDGARQADKKAYSEAMSARIAMALASEQRGRGMRETRPSAPGDLGLSGAERRLAGGIGAKNVDVTWATEESGLFLDMGASSDATQKRKSTFANAFPRLRLFTGRQDPASRDEQSERLYLVLVDASPRRPVFECYHVSDAKVPIALADVMDELVGLVAERNFDFYEADDGMVHRV